MKTLFSVIFARRVCLFFFLALSASAQTTTNTLAPPVTLAALRSQIAGHLAQPRLAAAALGLKVVSLDTGKTLFEENAGKLLKPASNAKLYSGALALDRLGPGFRIKTSVYAAGKPAAEGVLAGDLVIFGRGDPSFAARFNNGDYQKSLAPLVNAIAAAGVKQIAGDLVGDESYFRGTPAGSGWTWDDLQYYYGAEVSALTAEDNTVDLTFRPAPALGEQCFIATKPATPYLTFSNRTTTVPQNGLRSIQLYRPIGENIVYVTGSIPLGGQAVVDAVAVHQPALWFVTLLRAELARAGITVRGKLRTVSRLDRDAGAPSVDQLMEIASVDSPPLSEILGKMMKPSQNLYAQLLLLQVGVQIAGDADRETESRGITELKKFLGEIGIRNGEVLLEEGSGLSRSALLTPRATVALLQHMNKHKHAAVFYDSLPVAGVDGTLRARFGGSPAANNVRAKTGTLRYVNCISGYLTTAAKEKLVFSIMLNNYNPATGSGRNEVDSLVLLLTGLGVPSSQEN